jgi:protein phosphatase
MRCELGFLQDIGDRTEQQDACGFSEARSGAVIRHAEVVGVIADGVGGLTQGALAAQTAVKAFLEGYRAKKAEESIPQALERALGQANEAVVEFSRQADVEEQTAATLVAAVLHDRNLHWISAGDSRAYLVRGGKVFRLTVDHNYATDLDDDAADGKVDKRGAANHPDRESVTSFIGMREPPVTDRSINPFLLTPGDRVLLCSDGLYRTLREDEIAACCAAENLQSGCARLVESVKQRQIHGQDNYTVLMMEPSSTARFRRRFWGLVLLAILVLDVVLLFLTAYRLGSYLRDRGRRHRFSSSLVSPIASTWPRRLPGAVRTI